MKKNRLGRILIRIALIGGFCTLLFVGISVLKLLKVGVFAEIGDWILLITNILVFIMLVLYLINFANTLGKKQPKQKIEP